MEKVLLIVYLMFRLLVGLYSNSLAAHLIHDNWIFQCTFDVNKSFSTTHQLAYPLQDAGHGEEGRGRDLRLVGLDRRQQVVRGVVEALGHLGEALRVGRPQHDHLVAPGFGPD